MSIAPAIGPPGGELPHYIQGMLIRVQSMTSRFPSMFFRSLQIDNVVLLMFRFFFLAMITAPAFPLFCVVKLHNAPSSCTSFTVVIITLVCWPLRSYISELYGCTMFINVYVILFL